MHFAFSFSGLTPASRCQPNSIYIHRAFSMLASQRASVRVGAVVDKSIGRITPDATGNIFSLYAFAPSFDDYWSKLATCCSTSGLVTHRSRALLSNPPETFPDCYSENVSASFHCTGPFAGGSPCKRARGGHATEQTARVGSCRNGQFSKKACERLWRHPEKSKKKKENTVLVREQMTISYFHLISKPKGTASQVQLQARTCRN
jgi:hypothetical protein